MRTLRGRKAFRRERTPLSKQRNRNIQRVLIEAAKLAPTRNPDLALVYENARQEVNANCATLAVARKFVAYLMAVDRESRDFQAVQKFACTAAQKPQRKENLKIVERADCQVPPLTD
jgi:hypothetical protein